MLARALSTVPVRVRPRPSLLSCVLCGDLCLVYRSRPPARVSLARRRSPIINYEGDGSGRAKLGWNVELAGKRRRKDEIELRAAGWFHTFPLAPSFWVCTLLIRPDARTSFFVLSTRLSALQVTTSSDCAIASVSPDQSGYAREKNRA